MDSTWKQVWFEPRQRELTNEIPYMVDARDWGLKNNLYRIKVGVLRNNVPPYIAKNPLCRKK
jgi:hypothetical protein